MVLRSRHDHHCANCGIFIGRRDTAVWWAQQPFCTIVCRIEHEQVVPPKPDVQYADAR